MKFRLIQLIQFFYGLLLILLLRGCYKEVPLVGDQLEDGAVRVLSFDEVAGVVDMEEHMILFSIGADTSGTFSPKVDFFFYSSIMLDGKELEDGKGNDLGVVRMNHPYKLIAKNKHLVDTFSLLFTPFPLIHILAEDEITDEPKVLTRMLMQYGERGMDGPVVRSFESFAGVEIRGKSSMRYGKKSFGLELWNDRSGKDYASSLLDMRFLEDWILDAMYIDELRMRNKISFEIWEKMAHPPPEDQRDYLFPGIKCRFVELIINNRYHGLYNLNEKLNPDLLQFSDDQDDKGGVLYKAIDWTNGSTQFENYQSEPPDDYIWEGWEQVYPEQFVSWEALADLRKLIVDGEDSEFEEQIGTLIDLDNALNYYLFINLIRAYDNSGKNTFLVRYSDQSRFFFIPWDMDGTWGRWWDGKEASPGGIIENHLFKRLKDTNAGDFNAKVASRWEAYRSTIFSRENLYLPLQEYHHSLISSGALERENKRWDDISLDHQEEYSYVVNWLDERLKVLDSKFDD